MVDVKIKLSSLFLKYFQKIGVKFLEIYKTISLADYGNRNATPLTADEQTDVRATVTKFIELFKAEHL